MAKSFRPFFRPRKHYKKVVMKIDIDLPVEQEVQGQGRANQSAKPPPKEEEPTINKPSSH